MYVSILLAVVFCVAVSIWGDRALVKQRTVRIDDNILRVGKETLPIAEIIRVDIASLYDVAPADDLWIFVGAGENNISFFNRSPGAGATLRLLEAALQGLDSKNALRMAREESMFEEPVTVWRAA